MDNDKTDPLILDPLVLVTSEIINVPGSRGLAEEATRTFFDFVALGGEQVFELFTQLGAIKLLAQILDMEAFEELRTRLAADNEDPTRILYRSSVPTAPDDVSILIIIRPFEELAIDADAVRLGRELALVHLARLIEQTGSADLSKAEVLATLKMRIFGNVSAFEQMCQLEPRTFHGVSWADLFDR